MSATLPKLSTVKNLPQYFPSAGLTVASIHGDIFKAQDRFNSRGDKILGNGLAETGAIIRRGRKVLIDVDKYAAWLIGGELLSDIKEKPATESAIAKDVGNERKEAKSSHSSVKSCRK